MEIETKFNNRIQGLANRIHEGFNELSIEEARKELLLWISWTQGINALKLRLSPPNLDETTWQEVEIFAEKRSQGIPFAYIMGKTEFYGLELTIGPGVLIPRPETEELVELALEWLQKHIQSGMQEIRILDLCTGSGCIAVAIGHTLQERIRNQKLPSVKLTISLSDSSSQALNYARANANRYGSSELEFRMFQGDMMNPFKEQDASAFDLIVCNPPYVHPDETPALSAETYMHEPAEALFHPDPPALYLQILKQCLEFLNADGLIILELSPFISEAVLSMCEQEFPECYYRIESDLSGKDRFLIFACKPGR